MPRTLPWMQKSSSSSTTVPRPKATASRPPKRSRAEQSSSCSEGEESASTKRAQKGNGAGRHLSSSPVPEPPIERFMDEGLEHDDKYRMVEDEFLTTAQRFTRHLYAAAYKKQQKEGRERNADAINAISRPVVGKMPTNTKRKVESVARSKSQRNALEALMNQDKDEDSDGAFGRDGLPYVGTTLHGLMDSPRKKSTSLSKFAVDKASTRAAAGFSHSLDQRSKRSESPQPKAVLHDGDSSEISDDDDLDAPVPTPKLKTVQHVQTPIAQPIANFTSSKSSTDPGRLFLPQPDTKAPLANSTRPQVDVKAAESRATSESRARIAKRLEQARSAKAKEEEDERKKKKLDSIPTFL